MYILVVNAGSSSLKYQLFDMDQKAVLAKGLCERIGTDGLFTHSKLIGDKASVKQLPVDLPDHAAAAAIVIKYLTDAEYGVIKDMSEIGAIGHRIVSGGPWLTKSCLIDGADGKVMATLRKCVNFAPLHTKGHIQCIEGCTKILPDVPQVLVMDTSFHQTMPKKAYTYPHRPQDSRKIFYSSLWRTRHVAQICFGESDRISRQARRKDSYLPSRQRLVDNRGRRRQVHRHLDGTYPA